MERDFTEQCPRPNPMRRSQVSLFLSRLQRIIFRAGCFRTFRAINQISTHTISPFIRAQTQFGSFDELQLTSLNTATMGPKKDKKKDSPGKKRANTPDDGKKPRHLDELGFSHADAREDGGRYPAIDYTLRKIVKYLRDRVNETRENRDTAELQRYTYDIATLQQEVADANQAYEDAKQAERDARTRVGFSPATKTAKAVSETLKNRLKRVQELQRANGFDRAVRESDHVGLVGAQSRLEDFLYFQETIRRWKRHRIIDAEQRVQLEAERLGRKDSYMLASDGKDVGHFDWLHSLLEQFDSRGIGDQRYKQGWHDSIGNRIVPYDKQPEPPVVGWQDLHLWTPRYRRCPSGLPRRINTDENGVGRIEDGVEQFEYDTTHEPGDILEPVEIRLDVEGIEAKRKAIESKMVKAMDDQEAPEYKSHTARREAELALYANTRPNTSGFRLSRSSKDVVAEEPWHKIRTDQGLFIAAKESSWDWLTSYDCLDKVRPGVILTEFPESAVRDEPDYILDRGDDYDANDDIDLPETPEDENPPELKEGQQPENRSHLKRKANIDYPYPRKEFILAEPKGRKAVDEQDPSRAQDGKPSRRLGKLTTVTPWAEETDGRREWHIYQQLSPCSSVCSPPRSPLMERVVELENPESVPGAAGDSGTSDIWRVVDDGEIPPLELNRRRCKSNEPDDAQDAAQASAPKKLRCKTNNCRAWWYHPAEECWVVHSTKTQRPADDMTEEQLRPIGSPQIQTMPESGVRTYVDRLHDHFGIRQPEGQAERWPKLGIRVPYEPRTYDDRKVDPDRSDSESTQVDDVSNDVSGNFIAKDARKRALFSVRSMDVPIIKKSQRDWGLVGVEPPPGPRSRDTRGRDGDDDGESDDDDDPFRKSYYECSFPNGRPPVPAVPGGGPAPAA